MKISRFKWSISLNTLILLLTGSAIGFGQVAETISYNIIAPSCKGCNDAVIDFSYDQNHDVIFLWSNGATSEDISGLATGNYNVQIMIDNTSTLYYSIEVLEMEVRSAEVTFGSVDPTCSTYSDGKIMLNIQGGSSQLNVIINGEVYGDVRTVDGLKAGSYLVKVYNSEGLIGEESIELLEPKAIKIESNVAYLDCLPNSAMIDLEISGGTGLYSVLWNDMSREVTRTNLQPGIYQAIVIDENYCVQTDIVEIPFHSGNMHASANIIAASGKDVPDGSVDITVSGGNGIIKFEWSDGYEGEDNFLIRSGPYSVDIVDANGCSIKMDMIIPTADDFSETSSLIKK